MYYGTHMYACMHTSTDTHVHTHTSHTHTPHTTHARAHTHTHHGQKGWEFLLYCLISCPSLLLFHIAIQKKNNFFDQPKR